MYPKRHGIARRPSGARRQDWRKLFGQLDRDRSGAVDYSELATAMRTQLHISHVRIHPPLARAPALAGTGPWKPGHAVGFASIVATVGARADGVAAWRFEARASRAAGDGATSKGPQAEPLIDRQPLRLRC